MLLKCTVLSGTIPLQFENNHLLLQTLQQYDYNNYIKIPTSKNDNFTALSPDCITEYSAINE